MYNVVSYRNVGLLLTLKEMKIKNSHIFVIKTPVHKCNLTVLAISMVCILTFISMIKERNFPYLRLIKEMYMITPHVKRLEEHRRNLKATLQDACVVCVCM